MEPFYYTKDKEEKEELTPLLLSDLLEKPELNRPILNFPYLRGGTINIGSENKVFKFEQDKGIWLGHQQFDLAPFKVDMAGKVTATGVNIQGQLIAGAGSSIDWSYIKNVQVQNAQIADLAVNNAKISDVSASKLTAGTIDANIINVINLNANNIKAGGTITGNRIQTAASGDRISLEITGAVYPHQLLFYTSDVLRGRIYSTAGGLVIWSQQPGAAVIIGTADDLGLLVFENQIGAKHLVPIDTDTYYLGDTANWWKRLYLSETLAYKYNNLAYIQHGNYVLFRFPANSTDIEVGGHFYPINDTGPFLGTSTRRWYALYTYFANIDYLGKNLNANTYEINNLSYLKFNSSYGRIYWGTGRAVDMRNTWDSLPSGTTGWHRWDMRVDMIPCADNAGQIGYDARRWQRIRAVNVVSGDFIFENKFRITEEGENALAIYNPKGKKILIIDDEGNIKKVNT